MHLGATSFSTIEASQFVGVNLVSRLGSVSDVLVALVHGRSIGGGLHLLLLLHHGVSHIIRLNGHTNSHIRVF